MNLVYMYVCTIRNQTVFNTTDTSTTNPCLFVCFCPLLCETAPIIPHMDRTADIHNRTSHILHTWYTVRYSTVFFRLLAKRQRLHRTHDVCFVFQAKVQKLQRQEILMVNIGSTASGGKVLAVKQDLAKILLTQPVCTQEGEKIALSRRVDKVCMIHCFCAER